MLQKGFSVVLLIGIILVVFTLGFFLLKPSAKYSSRNSDRHPTSTQPESSSLGGRDELVASSDEPPIKLKSIGIEFSDLKFTKANLQFGKLFMEFGFYIPKGNDNLAKYNPQPTYMVPLGTPVRSIVDGVVAAMPTLWSGDYSVQVTQDGKIQKWIYEMEHLINPKVKVGDRVTAGQIVGEVSDFNHGAPTGFGTVEIGILKGGQVPEHVCPFAYLDDTIKEETFAKMKDHFKSWEEYVGDQGFYDDSLTIPGCLTLDPIEG